MEACPQASANFLGSLKFGVQCESLEYLHVNALEGWLRNCFKEVGINGDGHDDADVDDTHTDLTAAADRMFVF